MFHKNFIILSSMLFFPCCQAGLVETLNQLSTTEKMVLSTMPFVVPVVAPIMDYYQRIYEPEELEDLENVKTTIEIKKTT